MIKEKKKVKKSRKKDTSVHILLTRSNISTPFEMQIKKDTKKYVLTLVTISDKYHMNI